MLTEKLRAIFGIPEDIQDKMVDLYNYMTECTCYKLEIVFENGDKIQVSREVKK